MEAENNKTESVTESAAEETTTIQADNVDMEDVTEQPIAGQKQSKQSKEDKIHKLTMALRNLSNKSRLLKDAIRKQRVLLQADVATLRKLRRQNLRRQKNKPKVNLLRKEEPRTKIEKKNKVTNMKKIDKEKRKLIEEWRNIEKNSLLLGNTAKAFIDRLEGKEKGTNGQKKSENAAQILPTENVPDTDEKKGEVEEDNTNVTFDIDDPSILALDDPSILIDDEFFEEPDDTDSESPEIVYDTEDEGDSIPDTPIEPELEIEYEIEYEDDIVPIVEVEYDIEGVDIVLEDTPVEVPVPIPVPGPVPEAVPVPVPVPGPVPVPVPVPAIQPPVIDPGPYRHNYPIRPRPPYPASHYPRPAPHPHIPRPRPHPYPSYPRYPQPGHHPPHITLTGSLATHRRPKNHRIPDSWQGHNTAFSDILG